MSDNALDFVEERGLGKVCGRVRLGSAMATGDGADGRRVAASLVRCTSGLWLVAARDRFHGVSIDLLTRADLRLVARRLTDQLCFGQEALTIPAGRRHAVEQLIALARLGSPDDAGGKPPRVSRMVHARDELGRAFLRRELAVDEVLICFLRGSNSFAVESHVVGETRARPFLMVTERRAAIVAWSCVGDVSYAPLRGNEAKLTAQGDRVEISTTGGRFVSARGDAAATRDAFEALGLDSAPSRLLEAARRLWSTGHRSPDDAAHAMALLDAGARSGSERARFAGLLASAECEHPDAALDPAAVATAVRSGALPPAALGDLWTSFHFSIAAGSALIRALLALGEDGLPLALALQRRMHDEPSADEATAHAELRLARFAVETRLASAACPDERDHTLRDVLAEGALTRRAATLTEVLAPLSNELIEGALCHPLSRGQGSLVASAQQLIALHPEPDQAALSDYCEALDSRQHPAAKRALDAARFAFSLPNLLAYVSRGKKSIGLRGYDGKAPYLLLGNAHLDTDSPFWMTEAELTFAIGAEALHLKRGHTRLTSHEVWAGAFARTKGGVELVLGVLPLFKGIPLAASAAKILERIPEPALRRALELLVRFEPTEHSVAAERAAPASALSHINEHLVAAHRLMQMSADRAGVALCGDLRSSLRALLLVRPDTYAVLELMTRTDLVSALEQGATDAALQADLIVRIASLLDFYVSDEYLTLRNALAGRPR